MLGDPGYSECSHVTRVEEWVGQANITLQRMGNLEQRVGVVCHTLPLSASEFSDYLPRQQHPNSTVWFEVNQREANCSIEIINDTSGETLERFYVQLGEEVRGRAILGEPGAIHCIEINNDREDCKFDVRIVMLYGVDRVSGLFCPFLVIVILHYLQKSTVSLISQGKLAVACVLLAKPAECTTSSDTEAL